MALIPSSTIEQVTQWRQYLHQIPELGLQEHQTSQWLIERLKNWGLEITTGFAQTGFVASLRNGDGPSIGLRTDMDALPIQEVNAFAYQSKHANCMHACGHDGHMALILGAAHYLSQSQNFQGTVHFVFQPAEENAGGGQMMIDDGLFEQFPMQAIFGLHNWPGLPAGHVAVNPGPMMASHDSFRITIQGRSCHAAMPDQGADPIVASAHFIVGLQSIISRRLASTENAVLSITQINAGESMNVIPDMAELWGTIRCLQSATRDKVIAHMNGFIEDFFKSFDVTAQLHWEFGYPVTLNHPDAARQVYDSAVAVLGESKVHWDEAPSMAAEDFSFMLQACPGAYFWLGAGGTTPSVPLHNARYDFNDAIIEPGIQLWVSLVERTLPRQSRS